MFWSFGALGIVWVILWLAIYSDVAETSEDQLPFISGSNGTGVSKPRHVPLMRFLTRWPFWAIYIAHFSMNWTNYIVMQVSRVAVVTVGVTALRSGCPRIWSRRLAPTKKVSA